MERRLFSPFVLTYEGRDADRHQIDLVQVGQSLSGVGRLYNAIVHYYFHGVVPARNSRFLVRTYVGEPREGSITYILVAAVLYDQFAAYPQILCELADVFVPKLLGAVFARRTKQTREMERVLDIIQQMHADHHELAKTALQGAIADRAQLISTIDKLATNGRAAMTDMVAPISHSCRTIIHFDQSNHRIVIDEPTADVMRSREELEVGAQMEVLGIIRAVDTTTGSCKVEVIDGGCINRGKITDPALKMPHNVYTAALDDQSIVVLTAKPVLRQGEVSRLYISDARLRD